MDARRRRHVRCRTPPRERRRCAARRPAGLPPADDRTRPARRHARLHERARQAPGRPTAAPGRGGGVVEQGRHVDRRAGARERVGDALDAGDATRCSTKCQQVVVVFVAPVAEHVDVAGVHTAVISMPGTRVSPCSAGEPPRGQGGHGVVIGDGEGARPAARRRATRSAGVHRPSEAGVCMCRSITSPDACARGPGTRPRRRGRSAGLAPAVRAHGK